MAAPSYLRSPFGLVKRIRISPPIAPQTQRAGISFRQLLEEGGNDLEAVAKKRGIITANSEPPPLDPKIQATLSRTRLPRNVQAIYLRPLKRQPTYGVPVCDLQLRSYSVRNVEFFADFALRAAYYLGLAAKGPVPLPRITERWTVPRSHFIFKKSQENFERVTLRRLIQIQDGHPEAVKVWLGFLEKHQYHGVGMKANVWEFEELDVGRRMEEEAGAIGEEMEGRWRNFGARKNRATAEMVERMVGKDVFRREAEGESR